MTKVPAMHISCDFDAGNIEVLDASDASSLRLRIRPDIGGEHLQWFHFRVTGGRATALRLVVENAIDASYPHAWEGYRAVASYDREHWFRVPTSYVEGELIIEHTPERDSVYYAYFAPYPMTRHHDLVARSQCAERCRLEVLGQTLDGQDIDLLTLGEPGEGRLPCWVFARQHPGESMAEWLVEGLLERLLDANDSVSRAVLERAVVYVVPNMNPDGSRRGHLRTNAAGTNLNREWATPTMERSPEVLLVRDRMDAMGVRFALDVHGDEALPYNFIAGFDGVEGVPEAIHQAMDHFQAGLVRACPDFQRERGYPKAAPGAANMTMATNQLAARFGALSMTLEMPFKDNAVSPDAEHGWSPARSKLLGRAILDALHLVLDEL